MHARTDTHSVGFKRKGKIKMNELPFREHDLHYHAGRILQSRERSLGT